MDFTQVCIANEWRDECNCVFHSDMYDINQSDRFLYLDNGDWNDEYDTRTRYATQEGLR